MKNRPFTLLIHIALVIILAGATVTHFYGIQGMLTLEEGAPAVRNFDKTSGPGDSCLPFSVALERIEVSFYPGTTTPMDFKSVLKCGNTLVDVSMNKIGVIDGWRFYQSGLDGNASKLAVSRDPYGIFITYTGYLLLGIGLIGFFFQPSTPWRGLIRRQRSLSVLAMLFCMSLYGSATPKAMQRPLASNLCKAYVYWNDRICPLQTMARDVSRSLYGSESYQGMTSEQVLSGWLFYYDEWLRDYRNHYPEINDVPTNPVSRKDKKTAEGFGLIQWLGTGEAFRIYPYHSSSGNTEWLSLTGRRPSKMPLEQWKFMQTTMPDIKRLIMDGKNIEANELVSSLIEGQRKYAGESVLPSDGMLKAEILYNKYARPSWAAGLAVILTVILWCFDFISLKYKKMIYNILSILNIITLLYVIVIISAIGCISRHVPLSNGPETMLFMGMIALFISSVIVNREVKSAMLLVAGMALAVAAMASSTPRIGALMPVLDSPLLSIHVMLVMISYALFLLMSVLSAAALLSKSPERKERLCVINRIVLTPAVCLLAAGIFIGAVWANQSWGRYWGWDPKETCALVMLLIYSVPMHWGTRKLKCFRDPLILHTYLLVAVLTVLFTYFGANYLLPGLHSYA